MNIVGVCGSLRTTSFNLALLRAAEQFLPEGVQMGYAECKALPLYNEEIDTADKPRAVARMIECVRSADAIVIATPEYNHSIPGVLKNAIDWISRPAYASVLAHKPAAILSASKSIVGGARVQAHLQQVLASTLTSVFPHPQLLVPLAAEKFDPNGRLIDAETITRLRKYMFEFVLWAGRHRVPE